MRARDRAQPCKGLPADFDSLTKMADETRNYVPKLQAIKNIVADPQKYGLVMADVPERAVTSPSCDDERARWT